MSNSATPLVSLLRDEPAVLGVLGRSTGMLSVPEAGRALTIAGLAYASAKRPFVVAVPTQADAEWMAADLAVLLGEDEVELFPAWETLPFERVSPSVETMGRRSRVLWRLRDPDRAPRVVISPIRALLQRMGPHVENLEPIIVGSGDIVDVDTLVRQLVDFGYRREYQVEHRGEVAVRGSIVDVFPSTADAPIRIDLWGDEVERLTRFGIADQRSLSDVAEVEIFPCRELMPTPEVRERAVELVAQEPWGREQWERLAEGQLFDGMESWLPWLTEHDDEQAEHVLLDLLQADAQVIMVDPARQRERAAAILADEADLGATLAVTWGADSTDFPPLHLDFDRLLAHTDAAMWTMTTLPDSAEVATVQVTGWPAAIGSGDALLAQVRGLLSDGFTVVVAAQGSGSAARIDQLLVDGGIALTPTTLDSNALTKPGGHLVVAPLNRGCVLPAVKLAVLSETDLTGRRRTHRPARKVSRESQAVFDDLRPGDYVVHHHHGVARYGGMVKRAIAGSERDYLLLEYRGDDKLYVPSDQIDAIRPYTGGSTPSLSKMGGADFARTKAKVASKVAEIAQELVVLYQTRLNAKGIEFPEDTPWQQEFEDAFPYQETADQLTAIEAVKGDMEAPQPMDRLVCGDVGFGKTEVAIRAVFKAVQAGYQAAVLVPTTLLASQHYQTFSDRFAPYPMRVEVLSRFLTNAEARKVLEGVRSGDVDVVIGTHRLLSEDLTFKRLGLLVVDEEQRFGVNHKERIKQIAHNVDVLTLTATPIPRTLEMSLTGIRDLSLLQTAPAERQPILTYVSEFDQRAVAEAIRRELLREGQVFYVHNRVQTIEQCATDLAELVPEARIAVAHGQMDEGSLERVVVDFWEGQYDVLVCTTIIESGIDMPTVNTLVVERADRLGLGQLHQIRGRVGRAGQRAYAYLFWPQNMELSETAYERLKTIGESTELGSGFRIAMRDLELRGAGNLLGTGQSGHIAAVGYDLYCQMVVEAIAELNGEVQPEPAEIKVDLPLAAFLPAEYVAREDLRVDAYRRLATVTTLAEVDDIAAEWNDRYGDPPTPAQALLAVARVRAECARTGVTEVTVTKSPAFGGPPLRAIIRPVALPVSKQMRLDRMFRGSQYKDGPSELHLALPAGDKLVGELLRAFTELFPVEPATVAAAGTANDA